MFNKQVTTGLDKSKYSTDKITNQKCQLKHIREIKSMSSVIKMRNNQISHNHYDKYSSHINNLQQN